MPSRAVLREVPLPPPRSDLARLLTNQWNRDANERSPCARPCVRRENPADDQTEAISHVAIYWLFSDSASGKVVGPTATFLIRARCYFMSARGRPAGGGIFECAEGRSFTMVVPAFCIKNCPKGRNPFSVTAKFGDFTICPPSTGTALTLAPATWSGTPRRWQPISTRKTTTPRR